MDVFFGTKVLKFVTYQKSSILQLKLGQIVTVGTFTHRRDLTLYIKKYIKDKYISQTVRLRDQNVYMIYVLSYLMDVLVSSGVTVKHFYASFMVQRSCLCYAKPKVKTKPI